MVANKKTVETTVELFRKRFRALIDTNYGGNMAAFERKSGILHQTMNKWYNGKSTPDLERLVELCKATGYSADWFLGLTPENNKTNDTEVKAISAATGLGDISIATLTEMKEHDEKALKFINAALTDGLSFFHYCGEYVFGSDNLDAIKVDCSVTFNAEELLRAVSTNKIKLLLDKYYTLSNTEKIQAEMDAIQDMLNKARKELGKDGANDIDGE